MSQLSRRKVVRWSRRPAKPNICRGPFIVARALTPPDELASVPMGPLRARAWNAPVTVDSLQVGN